MKTYFKAICGGLFIAVVLCTACARKVVPTVVVHDTISHTEVITRHDTAIFTKADSAYYYALIECEKNSAGNFVPVIHNQNVTPGKTIHINSTMNGNALTINCKTDSLTNVITILQKTISDFRKQTNTVTVEVKYIPWWVKILSWIGGVASLIGLVFVVWKLAKSKLIPL